MTELRTQGGTAALWVREVLTGVMKVRIRLEKGGRLLGKARTSRRLVRTGLSPVREEIL